MCLHPLSFSLSKKKCREPGNAKFRALSFQPLDNFCQHLPGALSKDLKTLGVQVYYLSIALSKK